MPRLQIVKKNNYEYFLKDEYGQNYNFNIEFLDIEEQLQVNDYIYMNEKLLNPTYEGYSLSYTFGDLKNKYGKNGIEKEDIDVIKVEKNEVEIYLKRLYG